MSELFDKVSSSYENLWKAFVRPPRDEYKIEDLGPEVFYLHDKKYRRRDFPLRNRRGLTLQCSLWGPDLRLMSQELPCVIYLHGNSSSRIEALSCLRYLLPLGILVVCFDFGGTGHSEGEYISLGHYEQGDVGDMVSYLRGRENVGKIGLWGRSMGAVTAMLYAMKDEAAGLAGMVIDSPFMSIQQLSEELAEKKTKMPLFVAKAVLSMLRVTVQKKIGCDPYVIAPIQCIENIKNVPAFFTCGIDDTFTPPHHTQNLHKKYGCKDKSIVLVEGDHNSVRPKHFFVTASEFFQQKLGATGLDDNVDYGCMGGGDLVRLEPHYSTVITKNVTQQSISDAGQNTQNNQAAPLALNLKNLPLFLNVASVDSPLRLKQRNNTLEDTVSGGDLDNIRSPVRIGNEDLLTFNLQELEISLDSDDVDYQERLDISIFRGGPTPIENMEKIPEIILQEPSPKNN